MRRNFLPNCRFMSEEKGTNWSPYQIPDWNNLRSWRNFSMWGKTWVNLVIPDTGSLCFYNHREIVVIQERYKVGADSGHTQNRWSGAYPAFANLEIIEYLYPKVTKDAQNDINEDYGHSLFITGQSAQLAPQKPMDLYNPEGQTIQQGQCLGVVWSRIRWIRNAG